MNNLRIYHDWEFFEDGERIHPISVGMVADDGRELYRVFAEAPWDRIEKEPWLMKNVVPKLGVEIEHAATDQIREDVKAFLRPPIGYTGIELWAWYGSYDHVCLAQLFGRMIDLPNHIPMWTNDLRQEQHLLGDHPLPHQSTGNHNALADAKHTQFQHQYLLSSDAMK